MVRNAPIFEQKAWSQVELAEEDKLKDLEASEF